MDDRQCRKLVVRVGAGRPWVDDQLVRVGLQFGMQLSSKPGPSLLSVNSCTDAKVLKSSSHGVLAASDAAEAKSSACNCSSS